MSYDQLIEKLEIVKKRGEALNFLGFFAAAPSEARGENRPS